jgi:hypothetical protein
MTKFINMTPNGVRVLLEDGTLTHEIRASGNIVKLVVNTVLVGEINVTHKVFGEPVGLPPAHWVASYPGSAMIGEGASEEEARKDYFTQTGTEAYDCAPSTFYIVSQSVKSALPHRLDLLVAAEVIIGCKSLGV